MNLERYKYHVVLASFLEAPPIERFSALRHEMYRIVDTYCGYAEILRIQMSKTQEASQKLIDFLNQLKSICLTLRELMEATRFKMLTEAAAEQGLLTFWGKYEIVESALSIPDKMLEIKNELLPIVPDYQFLLDHFTDYSLILWASFDMLANPGEPSLPSDILNLAKSLREFQPQITSGDLAFFPLLVEASRHEITYFRRTAAVLLMHYKNAEAVDVLIELLNDSVEEVVADASHSLQGSN